MASDLEKALAALAMGFEGGMTSSIQTGMNRTPTVKDSEEDKLLKRIKVMEAVANLDEKIQARKEKEAVNTTKSGRIAETITPGKEIPGGRLPELSNIPGAVEQQPVLSYDGATASVPVLGNVGIRPETTEQLSQKLGLPINTSTTGGYEVPEYVTFEAQQQAQKQYANEPAVGMTLPEIKPNSGTGGQKRILTKEEAIAKAQKYKEQTLQGSLSPYQAMKNMSVYNKTEIQDAMDEIGYSLPPEYIAKDLNFVEKNVSLGRGQLSRLQTLLGLTKDEKGNIVANDGSVLKDEFGKTNIQGIKNWINNFITKAKAKPVAYDTLRTQLAYSLARSVGGEKGPLQKQDLDIWKDAIPEITGISPDNFGTTIEKFLNIEYQLDNTQAAAEQQFNDSTFIDGITLSEYRKKNKGISGTPQNQDAETQKLFNDLMNAK